MVDVGTTSRRLLEAVRQSRMTERLHRQSVPRHLNHGLMLEFPYVDQENEQCKFRRNRVAVKVGSFEKIDSEWTSIGGAELISIH